MFEEMTDEGFVDFLAAMWERRGWETGVAEDEPGVFMITGDRDSGQRGLMLVVPAGDADVPGKRVQTVASICDAKNVDVGVVATRGTFSDDAQRIADVNDIHLLDTDALESTVDSEGMDDLVEEYTEGGDGDESLLSRVVPSGVPSVRSPTPVAIPTRGLGVLLVLAAVVAVAVAGAQALGVLPSVAGKVPAVGLGLGGGGSGFTVTAASLTTGNGSAVGVAWTARVQSDVVTDTGATYSAPEGSKFVVVQMNVTNHRDEQVIFRSSALGFAANNTRVGPQLLQGAVGQPPVPIPPGETVSVWVVFPVDDGADSGTLLGLPGEDVPPIRFHRAPDLEFAVQRP